MDADTIAVIAFDGINPFHLSIPSAVFGEDRSKAGVPRFKLLICAAEKGPLRTSAGFSINTRYDLKHLTQAATVIVPSWCDPRKTAPESMLAALRQSHQRGARIVGLCLGAFVLAQAGLLDGLPATTHWLWTEEFARSYPQVHVQPDVLYVDAGDILTSAGTVAGIDCCLHLLRRQYGAEVANRVARRMVVPPHRQGSQAQYIEQPLHISPGSDRFSQALDWASQNLGLPHSLDALAKRALMSRRTFTRRFRQTRGTTVGKWLLGQRLTMAQRLLETTDESIDFIAQHAGFGSALSLRQHFAKVLKTSPSTYRREFRRV